MNQQWEKMETLKKQEKRQKTGEKKGGKKGFQVEVRTRSVPGTSGGPEDTKCARNFRWQWVCSGFKFIPTYRDILFPVFSCVSSHLFLRFFVFACDPIPSPEEHFTCPSQCCMMCISCLSVRVAQRAYSLSFGGAQLTVHAQFTHA